MTKTNIYTKLVALVFAFTTILSSFGITSVAAGPFNSLEIHNKSNKDLHYFICDDFSFVPTSEVLIRPIPLIGDDYLIESGSATLIDYDAINADFSKTYTLNFYEANDFGQYPIGTGLPRTGGGIEVPTTFYPCSGIGQDNFISSVDFTLESGGDAVTRVLVEGEITTNGENPYLRAVSVVRELDLTPFTPPTIILNHSSLLGELSTRDFSEICVNGSILSSFENVNGHPRFSLPQNGSGYEIRLPKYDAPFVTDLPCSATDFNGNDLEYLIFNGTLNNNTEYEIVAQNNINGPVFDESRVYTGVALNYPAPVGYAHISVANTNNQVFADGVVCVNGTVYSETESGSQLFQIPDGEAIISMPHVGGCNSPRFYPDKPVVIEEGKVYDVSIYANVLIPQYVVNTIYSSVSQPGLSYVGPELSSIDNNVCVDGLPAFTVSSLNTFISRDPGTYSVSFAPLGECDNNSGFSQSQDLVLPSGKYLEFSFVDLINPLYQASGLNVNVLHESAGDDGYLFVNNAQQDVVHYINTNGKCGNNRVGITLIQDVEYLQATAGNVAAADQQAGLPGTALSLCNLQTNVDNQVGRVETYISINKSEVDKYDEVRAYIANSPWTEVDSLELESSENGINTYKITSSNYEQIALAGVDYDNAIDGLVRSGGQPLAITLALLPFVAVFALRHSFLQKKKNA